jgi:hypothetical protein
LTVNPLQRVASERAGMRQYQKTIQRNALPAAISHVRWQPWLRGEQPREHNEQVLPLRTTLAGSSRPTAVRHCAIRYATAPCCDVERLPYNPCRVSRVRAALSEWVYIELHATVTPRCCIQHATAHAALTNDDTHYVQVGLCVPHERIATSKHKHR